MGKPRLIILIRHAQSEGNKNREIHQTVPDHRVKLTPEGWRQAEDAGRRLRNLLKPDDTLQIFTSPYRRTRETTEGLLSTLTARHDPDDPSSTPSPFSRSKIKVYEEPRLREQDFGNFQPCSAEMERMWAERADYGHFFYRIPNGESAADAYDRISGFNESLWRQFGDKDFPSVCVLVTHGLMTRVFLMKWYHWSVEYFEDLRNINHCEFVIMRRRDDPDAGGKYILETELRTWSELKKQRAAAAAAAQQQHQQQEQEKRLGGDLQRRNTLSSFLKHDQPSPTISPARQWGGCVGGCNHQNDRYPRRKQVQEAKELSLPPSTEQGKEDEPLATATAPETEPTEISPTDPSFIIRSSIPSHLRSNPRDPSSNLPLESSSGTETPHEMDEDEGHYFHSPVHRTVTSNGGATSDSGEGALAQALRRVPQRKATHEDIARWTAESGMGRGTLADALGDEDVAVGPVKGEEGAHVDEHREQGGEKVNGEKGGHEPMNGLEEAEKADRSLRGSVY